MLQDGSETLQRLKLFKLSKFCYELLRSSPSRNLIEDIVISVSFLLNCVTWASFGTYFKRAGAPKPKSYEQQMPKDEKGFSEFVENTLVKRLLNQDLKSLDLRNG